MTAATSSFPWSTPVLVVGQPQQQLVQHPAAVLVASPAAEEGAVADNLNACKH